jgi:2-keto-3-deoxy-L-rhamnonate aldolase RhmA
MEEKMQNVNRLKQILDSGSIALGTCVDSYSPSVVEVSGYSGLDFVRIDTEYSWRRDDSLEHMLRAAVIAELTPIVRIEKGNHYLVSKALQIGAGGVLVSDVESTQETIEVVRSAKFAPRGIRGYSSYSFSAGWGTYGGKDWIDRSNNEILVGIMVENESILSSIDEVMATEGLDFCLFGPADFSMSIGLGYPQSNHHRVIDALKKTVDASIKHNVAVGIGIGQPWQENAHKYMDMGCRLLEIGHDLGILKSAWHSAITEIKQAG